MCSTLVAHSRRALMPLGPHLCSPHRSERYSGIPRPCHHTPHTAPPLWSVLLVTCAWSSCTQQAPQRTLPPSQHHSRCPVGLFSVHISPSVWTIHLRCTGSSSSDWSSTVWTTCAAPWRGTACWDSCWKARCRNLAEVDWLDLPEYLKTKNSVRSKWKVFRKHRIQWNKGLHTNSSLSFLL